ncbi:Uncharacterised protein [Mycobacteroides abscessus subsp. abscessus]|nr:hypothetical protein MMAS_22410 [Mycobacteroides abscessus subsp. massiliense CCUG 48898 = JCM 15300]SIN41015.1 Uncharacterised protein [Mycobacteroides abscessus subsp. abscessus]
MSELAVSGLIGSTVEVADAVDGPDAPDVAEGPDDAGPFWLPPNSEHPVRTAATHATIAAFRNTDALITAGPFTAGSMRRSGR